MSTCRLLINFKNMPETPQNLYVTYSRYEDDWISSFHNHPYTEFIYVENGKGEMKIENRSYPIERNTFLMIPPNVLHTEVSNKKEHMEYYVLGISNTVFEETEKRTEYNPVIPLGNISDKIRSLIIDIYREMQEKKTGYELLVESLYLQFTVLMMRKMKLSVSFQEGGNIRKEIAVARDYINAHYMEDIKLDEISQMVSLSKYHLSREFSKSLGKSPMQYINERRIWESKNLLTSTNLSILDIANEVGYSSASYFTKRFKESEGETPLSYKNKYNKIS